MRRALSVLLLALSLATVSASAAPRGEDGISFFSRIAKIFRHLVVHRSDGSDTMNPPKP